MEAILLIHRVCALCWTWAVVKSMSCADISTTFFVFLSCFYIHYFTGRTSCRHVCLVCGKPLLGSYKTGGTLHQKLAVLQPFRVWAAQMLPTSIPTRSLWLSLVPILHGSLGDGAQVKQARELQAAITHAVGIMLRLSESGDIGVLTHMLLLEIGVCVNSTCIIH